jgi:hypothetical protein
MTKEKKKEETTKKDKKILSPLTGALSRIPMLHS